MQIFIFGISTIIIYWGISFLNLQNMKNQLSDKMRGQVRLPKSNLWIGIIGIVVCCTLLFFGYFFPDKISGLSLFTISGFSIFILLCSIVVTGYINCRIDILDETFIYHTFFGRKYEIRYSDIIRTREGRTTTHIYTKDKHLYLDHSAVGQFEFYSKMYENQLSNSSESKRRSRFAK